MPYTLLPIYNLLIFFFSCRIQEAQTSDGRIWSFIFDGMSKDKTRLPILSNLDQLDQKFNNNVMGCIFHNEKRTQLYVSGPSVPVGSSYMIHCLHLEIKRCLDSGLPLPEKIYLQVDGASDNTAHCVYAAIEHLVGVCVLLLKFGVYLRVILMR